jgi:hypothetical protein
MWKTTFVALASIGMIAFAQPARAANVSAKKIFIKDNADAAKRQVQVLSTDAAITFSDAGDPATNGASLHLYSATDDFCVTLAGGPQWANKKGKVWTFKDKGTKDAAQLKNGKLVVSIKSGVTFTLADNGTQNAVNAQVQFGTGTRFCMRCTASGKNNSAKKFLGKNCAAAACDAEPSVCGASGSTTTTTRPGGTSTTVAGATTTTTMPGSGSVLKGALTSTLGRFNYCSMIGLPGANTCCSMHFAGTHACTYAELQSAASAGDLVGLKDISNMTVTSFWAIDNSQPALQQCQDDSAGGSGLNWEYGTAHTASRGEKINLDNAMGTLDPAGVQMSQFCFFGGTGAWVGCCQ